MIEAKLLPNCLSRSSSERCSKCRQAGAGRVKVCHVAAGRTQLPLEGFSDRGAAMRWILPPQIDNRFPGHPFVLVVFGLLTALTLGRSLVHLCAPDGGAQSVAHLPLDSFPAPAAQTVIFLFALWGLAQMLMGLVCLLALVRYRALIPLLLVLVALEYASRLVIGQLRVIETTATAPGAIANLVGVPLALLLLYFSRPVARG